jgi:hypothetical protein
MRLKQKRFGRKTLGITAATPDKLQNKIQLHSATNKSQHALGGHFH